MRMCIRARTIRLGEAEVYTHTRVVIRLYYIDREKKKSRTRAKGASERASESMRMCVCERETMRARA